VLEDEGGSDRLSNNLMQTHKAVNSERKQLEKLTVEKAHMEEELASLTADLEAFDEEIDQLRVMLKEEEQTLVSAQQRQVWKPTNPLTYACVRVSASATASNTRGTSKYPIFHRGLFASSQPSRSGNECVRPSVSILVGLRNIRLSTEDCLQAPDPHTPSLCYVWLV
jgi:hypothetical protein